MLEITLCSSDVETCLQCCTGEKNPLSHECLYGTIKPEAGGRTAQAFLFIYLYCTSCTLSYLLLAEWLLLAQQSRMSNTDIMEAPRDTKYNLQCFSRHSCTVRF